jgi:hypothetical protein
MLQGQTDAAGLMNDIIDAASSFAVKNKDGMFNIPPKQLAIIREVATILGETPDNLINASLEGAKLADKLSMIGKSFLPEEDRIAVANLAEFSKEKGGYEVIFDDKGTKKLLKDLSEAEINYISSMATEERTAALERLNFVEKFRLMGRQILLSLSPVFESVNALFEDSNLMPAIQESVTKLADFITGKLIPAFKDENSPIYKYLTGMGERLSKIFTKFTDFIDGENRGLKEVVITLFKDVAKPLLKESSIFLADVLRNAWKIIRGQNPFEKSYGHTSYKGEYDYESGIMYGSAFDDAGFDSNTGLYSLGDFEPPKVDDFIIKDNRVMEFNKDDLVIGGTSLMGQSKAPSSPYSMDNFNSSRTDSYSHHSPMNVNIRVSGTLDVKSGESTVKLTGDQLKGLVTRNLASAIEYELMKKNNFGSQKETSGFLTAPM